MFIANCAIYKLKTLSNHNIIQYKQIYNIIRPNYIFHLKRIHEKIKEYKTMFGGKSIKYIHIRTMILKNIRGLLNVCILGAY